MKKISLILVISGILIISGILMCVSYSNKEISLRNQSNAQIGKIEGVYDKMWKVIQQKKALRGQMKEGYHFPPRCQIKALLV